MCNYLQIPMLFIIICYLSRKKKNILLIKAERHEVHLDKFSSKMIKISNLYCLKYEALVI